MIKRHHEEIVLKLHKNDQKPGLPKTSEYDENKTSLTRRRKIRRFNRRLQQHEILLNLDEDERVLLAWIQARRDENDIIIDNEDIPYFNTAANRLYRVFNDGSFKKKRGGRFYGHWVQSIPAKIYPFRARLTIDDEPTVELDYSNLHPHMLYRIERKPVPEGDLYELEGVDSEKRSLVKALFNSLLNADSLHKAICGVLDPYPENVALEIQPLIKRLFSAMVGPDTINKATRGMISPLAKKAGELRKDVRLNYAELKEISDCILGKYEELKVIAEKIFAKHSPIRRHFGSGVGLSLQYKDSAIAEGIMLALDKKGIVSIPIHDSFIVKAKHEQDLRTAMAEEYQRLMKGESPMIEKKTQFNPRFIEQFQAFIHTEPLVMKGMGKEG